MIFSLYKQRGETPLQCLERYKIAFPEYENEKMTYLGRLDPMAEGVLLIASGGDTKQSRREEFFELDKDYDFSVLFGFATDSYDCLGKILKVEKVDDLKEMDLIKICKIYEGERMQKYPKYSSIMIDRPDIEPPIKKIKIYKMEFKGLKQVSNKELFGELLRDISKVKGEFRQTEILEVWKNALLGSPFNVKGDGGIIGSFSASVSSGTYIRSIVNDLGNSLGTSACALSITRTRVGNYLLKDSLRF